MVENINTQKITTFQSSASAKGELEDDDNNSSLSLSLSGSAQLLQKNISDIDSEIPLSQIGGQYIANHSTSSKSDQLEMFDDSDAAFQCLQDPVF